MVAQKKVEAGGFWVLRPDSGDPVEVVLQVRGWGEGGRCHKPPPPATSTATSVFLAP